MLDNKQLAQHGARPRRLRNWQEFGHFVRFETRKVQVALCMDRKLDVTFERTSSLGGGEILTEED